MNFRKQAASCAHFCAHFCTYSCAAFCAVFLSLILPSSPARAEPAITLMLVQRPPYLMINGKGEVGGLSVDPAVAAFAKAGIPVVWEELPAARQLAKLKANAERVCSVGWYKTAEREAFAKFTRPVSQDSPWVGIAPPTLTAVPGVKIDDILLNESNSVLLKHGFVYGGYLDKKIAGMRARREEVSAEMPKLLNMIAAGRASIGFFSREEIDYHLSQGNIRANDVKIINFSEMPPGEPRYLMCSKRVEDAVIRKFNAALR